MSDGQGREGSNVDPLPEITPINNYNFRKAKLNSSVAWLVSHAYDNREEPPQDLLDPLYQDDEGEDHVKPAVIYQLASGELYSRVCSSIFPPSIHPWEGHVAIVQGLSRRGIYVVDDRNQPVTESVLSQTQKIKLNAHVAMMDAIMKAYVCETVSIDKVVQAVRRFTTFNASSDLPFDLEDALLFWVNKVCLAVKHQLERDRKANQASLIQSTAPSIRVKRDQVQPKEFPHIPQISNLMKDLADGCCLATIIHHYYPHLLSLDDVTLQPSLAFADSLHNLQVVASFFQRNLPQLHHFTLEDLLYCHDSLRPNLLALLAQLFWCCEVERPAHLEADQGGFQSSAFTPTRMVSRPPLPISDATKRSFQAPQQQVQQSPVTDKQSVDLTKVPSSPNAQRRLLNRQQQQRSSIFGDSQAEDSTVPQDQSPQDPNHHHHHHHHHHPAGVNPLDPNHNQSPSQSQSILAWQETEANRSVNSSTFTRPQRLQESPTVNMQSSRAGSLLANVSIDSELDESQDFSRGLDDQANAVPGQPQTQQDGQEGMMTFTRQPRPVTGDGQVENEDLEVESLTSAASSRMSQRHTPEKGAFVDPKDSFNPALTHRTGGSMNGVNGSQASPQGSLRQSQQREAFDNVSSPASDAGSPGDSQMSRRNLKLDVHPVDILGSPRGPTNEFMPAVLRPLKEKSYQPRKMDERGEHGRHRNKHRMADPRMAGGHPAHSQEQGSDSSESVDATTPLSGESIADSLAGDLALQKARMARGGMGGFMLAPQSQGDQPNFTKGRHGEAFFISGSGGELPGEGQHVGSAPTETKSFTIADRIMTADDARQAGIPVVSASRSMQGLSEQGFHIAAGGLTTSTSDQELYQPHSQQHSRSSFQNPAPSAAAAPSSLPYSMHASDPYSTNSRNPNPHPSNPNPQYHHSLPSNPHHSNPHHGGNPQFNPLGNPHHNPQARQHAQPNPFAMQAPPEAYAQDQPGVATWGQQYQQPQQQFNPQAGFMSNPGMLQSPTNPNPNHGQESSKMFAEEAQSERQDKTPVAMDFSHNLSPVHRENGYTPDSERDTPVNMSQSGVLLTHSHNAPPVLSQPVVNHNNVHPHVHDITNPDPHTHMVEAVTPRRNLHSFAADVEHTQTNHSAFTEPPNPSLTTWGAKTKPSPNTEHPTNPSFTHNTINTGAAGNGVHYGSREKSRAGDGAVPTSDLTHIRLQLEEKRRLMDYEKRKLDRQMAKQRQRVGKAAFLQVLANKKQEKEANGDSHQRNYENAQWQGDARPHDGLTTFAALSANREKASHPSPQSRMIDQQQQVQQQQHAIQQNQLTQAYLLAQQNQSPASKVPKNLPLQVDHRAQVDHRPQVDHRAQQSSPHGHQMMQEGGHRSGESPRSGRDSNSPLMRSDSPQVTGDVPRRAESPGSSSGSHSPHLTQEEYNTSLEKLNANLSQLQGEIMRLSMQQEEMKKGLHDSPRQVQDSPRHVQDSPRQMGQGDFAEQRHSPEHRDVHRPQSKPVQDSPSQRQGFHIDGGDHRPESRKDKDSYILEENPAFSLAEGQRMDSPSRTQPHPQAFSVSPNEPMDAFTEKQTTNTQRLADDRLMAEIDDNKYIIPDNAQYDHYDGNDGKQNSEYENENRMQSMQREEEVEVPPPANQKKSQKIMAFDIDMGTPRQARPPPPANQRRKEPPTPKAAPPEVKKEVKKDSPPRTPVKKQEAPPSVYEIVGESGVEVTQPQEDLVVMPLEPANVSRDEDAADTSGMAAGFIIGEETAMDEMAKRKEMFLKSRLKREEEAKTKKAIREAEAERKREEVRKKQEEAELKKAEQAARREQIRQEYQRKKQAELDPDNAPPPPTKKKSNKARPKSTVISSGPSHSQSHSHHNYTALDGASEVGLKTNKGEAPLPSSQGVQAASAQAASAPPPDSDTGSKKSPSSSSKLPEAVKRRPPSPRPRANTLPGRTTPSRSPDEGQTFPPLPHIQAPQGHVSPAEGAVGYASPSVASQESSGSGGSQAADYSGPKLFVKPTSKSNRHIIINAISHSVLAGVVNEKTKDKVLQEIAKSDQKHFMILFRDHSLQFRSLYAFSPEGEELTKVYGTGPRHITNKMTEALYKYNSGGKCFVKVPSKSMSVQIDGVTINGAFWMPKRPATTKKH